jgi:hypothetical protein
VGDPVVRPLRLAPPVLAALALLVPAAPARADGVGSLVGLSAERVERFREALREFFWQQPVATGPDVLVIESAWSAPPSRAWEEAWDERSLRAPFTRDLAFEEELFLRGREEDYEDAARDWVEDSLKGSLPSPRPGRLAGLGVSPSLEWRGGPWLSAKSGPFTFGAGDGGWRVRYRRRVPLPGGTSWSLRVAVGEDDGEPLARFSFGRRLRNAWQR